jgi:type IV secretory pathway TrbL component
VNSNTILDILLIQSFDLDGLIEEYRMFFLALIPSMFILSCLIEYFDRLDWLGACKRAGISILILTSVTTFYEQSIFASIETADMKLKSLKQSNILLMDMFEGGKFLDKSSPDKNKFYKDNSVIGGTLSFLKYHLFDSFINDSFTVSVFFISKICFLIIKVVYSLVFYLGIGLIGIPCILYLFPSMGNVLRGAILSYIWCLVVPHILVFILSLIGAEINKGYVSGQIIGGSATGTALLFILALFIAFTPLVAMMLVNGSGMAHAGGIIGSIGANYVMNVPKNVTNMLATTVTGGVLGPKAKLAKGGAKFGFKMASSGVKKGSGLVNKVARPAFKSNAHSSGEKLENKTTKSSNQSSTVQKREQSTNNNRRDTNSKSNTNISKKELNNVEKSRSERSNKSVSNRINTRKNEQNQSIQRRTKNGKLSEYKQNNSINKKTNNRL